MIFFPACLLLVTGVLLLFLAAPPLPPVFFPLVMFVFFSCIRTIRLLRSTFAWVVPLSLSTSYIPDTASILSMGLLLSPVLFPL